MPTFDFQCGNKKCGHVYSELTSFDEKGKYPGITCPQCKSKRKSRLVNGCANFTFAEPEGTARWISEGTGHDYRFKHKQPSVRKEVENAKKKSHMGDQPYSPIDDLSSGKYFGDVK